MHRLSDELPPAAMSSGAFLVGEPYDSDAGNGQPRFQGFWERRSEFFQSDRPITRAEFQAETERAI